MGCGAAVLKPKPPIMTATDPFALFEEWFALARESEPSDPDAMALATADTVGNVSVRMVLLKAHGPQGFTFYTNRQSAKAQQLAENGSAALLLHWKSLRRQVRVEGEVASVSDGEADAYFATRSRDSQLGAWASHQSRPLDSRATFEAQFAEMERRFAGQPVPRPAHWGGFRVKPLTMEFWQDRPHRLHERQLYLAQEDGSWASWLLYP